MSHAILAFTFIPPLVAMICMGIGYSVLACALWPMVSLVIPTHQLGTAYGIMQSVQNLGLGCVVMAAGYIVDLMGNIVLEIFFLGWLSCKFSLSFTVCYLLTFHSCHSVFDLIDHSLHKRSTNRWISQHVSPAKAIAQESRVSICVVGKNACLKLFSLTKCFTQNFDASGL